MLFEYFNEMLQRERPRVEGLPWLARLRPRGRPFEQACAEIIERTACEGLRVCGIITDASLAEKLDEEEIFRENSERMEQQLRLEVRQGPWEWDLDLCEDSLFRLEAAEYVTNWLLEEALLCLLTTCEEQD
jgi:hypothetical protein